MYKRQRTYQNAQHTAAHATIDVRSRHRTNPRTTRFVVGKANENRRRPRSYHVDPLSRRREVAHGVLCSSPKPEQTIFSPWSSSERRGIDIFCRLFSTHQPTTRLRSRYRISPRLTRFVSCTASEDRWRPPKFHVDPWSRGREVARDVLRSLPKPKKGLFFAIGDGSTFFVICFLYTSSRMFFFSDARQAPAMYHRRSCELCDPRVGRSP